jgi:hypothetical protein
MEKPKGQTPPNEDIYPFGGGPQTKKQRKHAKDTRGNRAREISVYNRIKKELEALDKEPGVKENK